MVLILPCSTPPLIHFNILKLKTILSYFHSTTPTHPKKLISSPRYHHQREKEKEKKTSISFSKLLTRDWRRRRGKERGLTWEGGRGHVCTFCQGVWPLSMMLFDRPAWLRRRWWRTDYVVEGRCVRAGGWTRSREGWRRRRPLHKRAHSESGKTMRVEHARAWPGKWKPTRWKREGFFFFFANYPRQIGGSSEEKKTWNELGRKRNWGVERSCVGERVRFSCLVIW